MNFEFQIPMWAVGAAMFICPVYLGLVCAVHAGSKKTWLRAAWDVARIGGGVVACVGCAVCGIVLFADGMVRGYHP